MVFDFIQLEKGLYNATFNVVYNGNVVGSATLKGKLSSMEGKWTISCFNDLIEMTPNIKFSNLWSSKKHRPYKVTVNNSVISEVYQTTIRVDSSKVCYHTMQMNARYDLFTVAFGSEGFKSSVFKNDLQIMQINKSAVVYNDLHNYKLFCADKEHIVVGLIFCCYMYTIGCYKPGTKVYSSVHKTYAKTKNRFLLSKYNPYFERMNY